MIEILGFIWLTCFLLSAMLTFWNIRFVTKTINSEKLKTLNKNLSKVGMFWSLSSESFQTLGDHSPETDAKKATRSYLLMGCLGFFSFIGFLLLLAVSVSLRYLMNRASDKVMHSDLAQQDLSSDKVQELIKELSS